MAAGTPRVFVSHLSGVPVFDPNGDQVGRVRDLVAMLRVGGKPPRLLGMVVEVVSRRRIFLPMTRVTGVESGQVITTGVVNMRRFEQRPTERLVLGEFLDRRVRLVETDEEVTVLDVAIQQLPARRDWEIDKLFVRKGRGGALRRKGEALTVEWSAVTGFSLEQHGGAESLVATFDRLRPTDVANAMHHLTPKRRAEVAAALDDDRLADVLEELPGDDQVEIIGKLKEDRAADVLEAMAPDDAADLLSWLPEADKERLLTLMRPDDAADVRRLLSYEERTAGGLMTTEPIILRPDATVADALARVRQQDLSPALDVYKRQTLVSALVDSNLVPLAPDTPLPAVTSYLAAYNLVSAPVVDESGSLLGAVTVDDVLDHLLPEDWRENDFEDGEEVPGGR
ncbi:magnesium transporter MgtE N-terminal domain-containing protein [Streptomyces sp. NRRL WC-3549]|uniref:magnesium transporter MgtE N-terminal domain-containing protein n=1 Tax=Streptomyces sp. NRRL WC-3549 TaxID=1463925 RepID=UPI0004C92835|nr:CBS domain-containing protein [Streptomyces sp. NRRL WC-3549]